MKTKKKKRKRTRKRKRKKKGKATGSCEAPRLQDSHVSPGQELPHGSRAPLASAACGSQLCTPGAALARAVAGIHPPWVPSQQWHWKGPRPVLRPCQAASLRAPALTGSSNGAVGAIGPGDTGCGGSLTHPGEPREPQPNPTKQTKSFLALQLPALGPAVPRQQG